jgi:hypothetical protein
MTLGFLEVGPLIQVFSSPSSVSVVGEGALTLPRSLSVLLLLLLLPLLT